MSTLFVGTYTQQLSWTAGRGEGIYVFRFNDRDGTLTRVSVLRGLVNPSFLALSRDGRSLFAVTETAKGNAVSLVIEQAPSNTADGAAGVTLKLLSTRSVGGDDPCHLTATSEQLFVANYSSGSVSLIPIDSGGVLGEHVQIFAHHGRSVHAERQTCAHAHGVLLLEDGKFALVTDLGIDAVCLYAVEAGTMRRLGETSVPAGSGPRSMALRRRQWRRVRCLRALEHGVRDAMERGGSKSQPAEQQRHLDAAARGDGAEQRGAHSTLVDAHAAVRLEPWPALEFDRNVRRQ